MSFGGSPGPRKASSQLKSIRQVRENTPKVFFIVAVVRRI